MVVVGVFGRKSVLTELCAVAGMCGGWVERVGKFRGPKGKAR